MGRKGKKQFVIQGRLLMWMMVMFDLPTESKEERKAAHDFRTMLLEHGFSMSQFSVYVKFTGVRENSARYVRIVRESAPTHGDISILFFTDKQFSEIIHIRKRENSNSVKATEQYVLF